MTRASKGTILHDRSREERNGLGCHGCRVTIWKLARRSSVGHAGARRDHDGLGLVVRSLGKDPFGNNRQSFPEVSRRLGRTPLSGFRIPDTRFAVKRAKILYQVS